MPDKEIMGWVAAGGTLLAAASKAAYDWATKRATDRDSESKVNDSVFARAKELLDIQKEEMDALRKEVGMLRSRIRRAERALREHGIDIPEDDC